MSTECSSLSACKLSFNLLSVSFKVNFTSTIFGSRIYFILNSLLYDILFISQSVRKGAF